MDHPFDTVQTLRIEGALDGSPLTVLAQQPSRMRLELQLADSTLTQTYDGAVGWQMWTGQHAEPPSKLAGADLEKLADQASSAIGGALVHASQRHITAVYAGRETLDGKDCVTLKLTLPSGMSIREHIDASTYLELREDFTQKPGRTIHELVSDYRRFDGILFPFLFVSWSDGDATRRRLRISKIVVNPPLSDAVFTLGTP